MGHYFHSYVVFRILRLGLPEMHLRQLNLVKNLVKSKQISYPSEHELISPITAFSTVHVNSFTIAPRKKHTKQNDTRSPPGHLQRRDIPKHLYYYFPPHTHTLNH